jgi:hypothetical protein
MRFLFCVKLDEAYRMNSEIKSKKKRLLFIAGSIGFGLTVVIVLMGLIHRSTDLLLNDGGFIHITPTSLWGSYMSRAGCKIVYKTKDGEVGSIILFQNFLNCQPAMITPGAEGKTFLCLYETDTYLCLLKIDPTKRPKQFLPKSDLNWIVLASSWDVESGTTNDWQEIRDYLKTVPLNTFSQEAVTTLDLGFIRLGLGQYRKENLLQVVEQQIKNMRQYGATY